MQSHNVDAFSKQSELSPVEPSKSTGYTNLHTLQKVPADPIPSTQKPSNALPQSIDRVHCQDADEIPGAKAIQYSALSPSPQSLPSPISVTQSPPLETPDVMFRYSNPKSTMSSRNSPDRGNIQDTIDRNLNAPSPLTHKEPTAMRIKADEFSQKIAADVVNRMTTGTLEEIQSILRQSVRSLFNADGTRKRNSEDASLGESVDPKRKRVACEYCPKTMIRHCDLK